MEKPIKKLTEKERVKIIKKYVVDYLKRERPWVLLMDEEILQFCKKRKSGTINFSVRIHQSKTQDMVVEVLPASKTLKFTFKK